MIVAKKYRRILREAPVEKDEYSDYLALSSNFLFLELYACGYLAFNENPVVCLVTRIQP